MNEANQKNIQDKMRQLVQNYLKQLDDRIDKIEHFCKLLEINLLTQEDREELRRYAHKLSGTGATYGFPAISESGRALEEWLDEHPDYSETLLQLTYNLLTACRDAKQSKATQPHTMSQVFQPALAENTDDLPLLLVVDDDESTRDMLIELFCSETRIMTGTNSDEALEMMSLHQPDLVLLDDMMPGAVSGLRMLEKRRDMPSIRDIPVIMITASKKPEEVMRGLTAGASDYIAKPFDPKIVKERIQARLKRMSTQVLVADDDEAVRELLTHKFRLAGLKVILAEDGDEAWSILQKQKISLAILDRSMPGFDGMALLRKIRANDGLVGLPVMFLTASTRNADVVEARSNGAVDYIAKPFDANEVVIRCLRTLNITNKQAAK
jgi:DNA-binding response OmpR family regulator/HPt (histidine-containing phosphotransfer) domain-containing protein